MTNYNDGKWHGWNGGECPVHPETVVEVATSEANGKKSNGKGVLPASEYYWDHVTSMYPIIAFRVIKEHKEPREFLLGANGGYYNTHMEAMMFGAAPFIKVREVLE